MLKKILWAEHWNIEYVYCVLEALFQLTLIIYRDTVIGRVVNKLSNYCKAKMQLALNPVNIEFQW